MAVTQWTRVVIYAQIWSSNMAHKIILTEKKIVQQKHMS